MDISDSNIPEVIRHMDALSLGELRTKTSAAERHTESE